MVTITLNCKIVINEIQFAPDSPEPEWVEIFNTENNDLQLKGFTISDKITTSDPITISIEANGFAIITKDSANLIKKYNLNPNFVYETNIPILNNTDDVVRIDVEGITLDSLLYDSKWGEKGKSLERINYFFPSNESTNWGASTKGATPNQINSIAKYFDLSIISSSLESNGVNTIIENLGNIISNDVLLELYANDEPITQLTMNGLEPQSDNEYFLDFTDKKYEPKLGDSLSIKIKADMDINQSNNFYSLFVPNQSKKKDILINEIMYNTNENQFEFVELYNNSKTDIQLSNWFFQDAQDIVNNRFNLIKSNVNLHPQEYAILVSDSIALKSFDKSDWERILFTQRKLSLDNSGDIVALYNEKQQLIDSIGYNDNWNESYLKSTKGLSLEKLNPELESADAGNWKTCTNDRGSTPLMVNSYFYGNKKNENISVNPNPFSPTSSSSPYVIIEYQLPFDNALLDCDIYFPDGSKAINIVQSKFVSNKGLLTWNGRDEKNNVYPIGPYVAMIQATDQSTGKSEILKTVIVLAK